jgi:hypothetical protein
MEKARLQTACWCGRSLTIPVLNANVPVRIVATKHDTSIPMIERNYSKYIADHADVLSRRAMLDPSAPSGDNVISLR